MNDNRMKRWMDAIDDDLLEEAQRPLPRGGAARRQRRQHDPKAHHERPGPLGKQKPKQVLPDGDLHGAAHQGGNTLDGAIQRA